MNRHPDNVAKRESGLMNNISFWRNVYSRRKGIIFLAFLVTFIGVILGAYARSPKFESSARLFIKLDHRGLSMSRSDVRYDVANVMAEEAVASQAEILRSNELVAGIVDELGDDVLNGPPSQKWYLVMISSNVRSIQSAISRVMIKLKLAEKLTPREIAIGKINKRLRINPVYRSQIIKVSFRSKNKEATPVVLNSLLGLYMKKFRELQAHSIGYKLYQEQATRYRKELDDANLKLEEFKSTNGIVNLSSEKQMLFNRISKLRTVLDGIYAGAERKSASAAKAGKKQKDLDNYKGASTESNKMSSQVAQLVSQLNEFEIRRAKLLNRYPTGHLTIKELDSQIETVRTLLAKQREKITAQIKAYKKSLKRIQKLGPKLTRLERRVKIKSDAFDVFSKASKDRWLTKEEGSDVIVQVVDRPTVPFIPLKPTRLMIIIIGLLCSVVVGACAGAFSERLSHVRRD